MVLADVPPERKPEQGYVRQNHPFTKPPFYLLVSLFSVDRRVVSADVPPRTKTGTRARSPKPPFYETALLSPSEKSVFRVKKTMTATDVTGFDVIFSTGFFATFSRFCGARLTKWHINTGEKAKNPVESLQWRRRPEIADFCPSSWSNLS